MQELEIHSIGHYRIERRLARGGMSAIYLAQDTQSGRMVAIKLVHRDSEYYERFRHEVSVTAALIHKHILPVLDSGEENSWHYMVTPYIACGTLHRRLQQGPLSLQETGMVLEQLADAMQYAHDCGVLHRDIKPSNVLLGDEEGRYVYLADFGLGKRMDDDESLTLSGYLIGTPEYMAPELADQSATTSSDIYALGILTYQMLTGSVPFHGSTPIGTYLKHIREQPVPPSRLNPAISPSIDEVILKALDKRPENRFQSAQEFAQAYRQALEPEDSQVVVLRQTASLAPLFGTVSVKIRREGRRIRGTLVAGLAAAMLVGTLLLSLGLNFNGQRGTQLITLLGIGAQLQFTHLSSIPPELLAALSTHSQLNTSRTNGTTPQPTTTATPVATHSSNQNNGSITQGNGYYPRDSHHKKRKKTPRPGRCQHVKPAMMRTPCRDTVLLNNELASSRGPLL
jgi:serine/threonine protein kinase